MSTVSAERAASTVAQLKAEQAAGAPATSDASAGASVTVTTPRDGADAAPASDDDLGRRLLARPDEHHMENIFISISGLIGAGKTTLATALGKRLGLPVFYEPTVENSYLADFYANPAKYSFQLQIYLLNRRFRQQQQIIWNGRGAVQDRTIYEDSVFARMLRDAQLMDERDYTTYIDLFGNMSNFMRKPNVIVHLDVTPEESLERIRMRQRDCETTVSLDYLQNLHAAYEHFLKDISRVIPVIRVSWHKFRDADEMAKMISREYASMFNVRQVDWRASSEPSTPVKTSPQATPQSR